MRIARPLSVGTTLLLALVAGIGSAVIGVEATSWGAWVGAIPALLILGIGLRRSLRRWRLTRKGLPDPWRQWLRQHIPVYPRLDDSAIDRFERDVLFVMHEFSFEGVNGVSVTDELRLSVAAGVALLLHGHPDWELPGTRSVLFYPDQFDDAYEGGSYASYDGMAHEQGPLILTAASVRRSWTQPDDGNNVVLHELAHLFDFQNTGPDGVPSLVNPSSAASWQALVQKEMRRVRERRSMLRPYAAEAPSEFFAVAVEAFFEQPRRMARAHRDLFAALTAFFNLDPRTGRPPSDDDDAADRHVTGPGARSDAIDR